MVKRRLPDPFSERVMAGRADKVFAQRLFGRKRIGEFANRCAADFQMFVRESGRASIPPKAGRVARSALQNVECLRVSIAAPSRIRRLSQLFHDAQAVLALFEVAGEPARGAIHDISQPPVQFDSPACSDPPVTDLRVELVHELVTCGDCAVRKLHLIGRAQNAMPARKRVADVLEVFRIHLCQWSAGKNCKTAAAGAVQAGFDHSAKILRHAQSDLRQRNARLLCTL